MNLHIDACVRVRLLFLARQHLHDFLPAFEPAVLHVERLVVAILALVGQHCNHLATIESFPHYHCMLVVVDSEANVSRVGVCSLEGMCPNLIEGCDKLVEWRIGIVLCEPLCFSIDGVESARKVLFLAIVDCAICQ